MSIEADLQESLRYSPLQQMRHSAAHVMAEALQEMFAGAKFALGRAVEDGFYYDCELPRPLTPADFPEIEQRMARIVAGRYAFVREIWSRQQALQYFRERGQDYKVEIIEHLPQVAPAVYDGLKRFP
jgi:threonyl-tRNA synthetase